MKHYIKFIINSILEFIKQWWYKHQRNELQQKLEKEKKELESAKQNSDKSVAEFESVYELLRKSKNKKASDSKKRSGNRKDKRDRKSGKRRSTSIKPKKSGSNVRKRFREVRQSREEPENND